MQACWQARPVESVPTGQLCRYRGNTNCVRPSETTVLHVEGNAAVTVGCWYPGRSIHAESPRLRPGEQKQQLSLENGDVSEC